MGVVVLFLNHSITRLSELTLCVIPTVCAKHIVATPVGQGRVEQGLLRSSGSLLCATGGLWMRCPEPVIRRSSPVSFCLVWRVQISHSTALFEIKWEEVPFFFIRGWYLLFSHGFLSVNVLKDTFDSSPFLSSVSSHPPWSLLPECSESWCPRELLSSRASVQFQAFPLR